MPTPSAAAPTSTTGGVCPNCGAAIPADAVQGLCPKCLVAGIDTATQGSGSPPIVPALDAVAAAFPHLEILGLIGAGGMGAVFKARQPKLNRFVALKILPESLGDDPMFAERFAREGQLLARLSHPNIVTVHDFGQAGGFYYLLMEYVDGVNLREAMRASRFTAAQALSIVPKICEALQFAHDEGVLHRDIKPENILLDSKGRVKLADFGIAKMLADAEAIATPATPGEPGLTQAHGTLGTPQYMAPEQREAPAEVDQRADIYSLGVVFYELLTGELPVGKFTPPSARSDADARVDAIVRQALEREPRRRQRTADEVKTQIETVVREPVQPTQRSTSPGAAKLALGFLLAGILTPLLLLTFGRLNGGGLALTGVCFVLAAIFGRGILKEWWRKLSAGSVIVPVLCVLVFAGFLVVRESIAARNAMQEMARAREAEAMAQREALQAVLDPEKELQGEWLVVSQRTSGRDTTEAVAGMRISFKDDRMLRRQTDGSQVELSVRVQARRNPKELDLIDETKAAGPIWELGIYQLGAYRLVMAFNRAEPTRRPRGFVSNPENSIEVTTLQRVPPENPPAVEKSAPQ